MLTVHHSVVSICHSGARSGAAIAVVVAACLAISAGQLRAQTSVNLVQSLDQQTTGFQSMLIAGSDGNFYGTSPGGGPSPGLGRIFRLTLDGTFTVLHDFTGSPDGALPVGALVQGADGNFYGTTQQGGSAACFEGCGTVFRMTPDGTVTVLHMFTGGDGTDPAASLVLGSDGNFYGTTLFSAANGSGGGTIFRITPAGALTTLHVFSGADGAFPVAPLIQAADGNFYGTTTARGTGCFGGGCGTVFRMTPSGVFTVLHFFLGGLDGDRPKGALVQAPDGNFYGTTSGEATSNGTIFRMTADGVITTLHAFVRSADGAFPSVSLTLGPDGRFYGVTGAGGASDQGAVFSITANGDFAIVHAFDHSAGGVRPQSPLVTGRDGRFYGTTGSGGALGFGVVFVFEVQRVSSRSFAADFDGDGQTDLVIYRPESGRWFVRSSSRSYGSSTASTYQWGLPGDIPLSADFDGDRRTDLVVYRPGNGMWFIRYSATAYSAAAAVSYQWGLPGDVPLAADFDGDGRSDLVVYRPFNGMWFVRFSSTAYSYGTAAVYQWGALGDIPLVADFDGDHRADLAVYRPSTGEWYVRTSSSGYAYSFPTYRWGAPGDVPISADFDGDGRTDLAVWRPGNGVWFVRLSSTQYAGAAAYEWGAAGDIPIQTDFDGDGRTDLAVWRPRTGTWYLRLSSETFNAATAVSYEWGTVGDDPI